MPRWKTIYILRTDSNVNGMSFFLINEINKLGLSFASSGNAMLAVFPKFGLKMKPKCLHATPTQVIFQVCFRKKVGALVAQAFWSQVVLRGWLRIVCGGLVELGLQQTLAILWIISF